MVEQQELDRVYLNMANALAQLSTAERRKVGCLIVRDTHILAEGINGTPTGLNNKCEYYDHTEQLYTKREVIHGEANAIYKLAKSTQSSVGATLYSTTAPCFECAKAIIQSGIVRIVYLDTYRTGDGVDLLKEAELVVEQY